MQGQALAVGCPQVRQGIDTAFSGATGGGSTMTEFLSDTYITQLVGSLLSEYSIVLLDWIKKRFGK